MSIKDRFKMIMEREKLTAGAFAESIGVAQATISHILGPRNKYPSTEVTMPRLPLLPPKTSAQTIRYSLRMPKIRTKGQMNRKIARKWH